MNRTVIIENFWRVGTGGDRSLAKEDLGWPQSLQQDARSDYSEAIFRYVVEIAGFNILFYWLKDRNFYVIETEKMPIEVRRISPNPDWDGQCEFTKAASNLGPNTASPGEVLVTFNSPADIWDNLKIDGVPIAEIIPEASILTWD